MQPAPPKLRLRKTVSQSRCSHSRKGKSPRVYCLDPARQAHWLYQNNDKPHVHLMGSPFCDVSLWGSKKCLIAVGWWWGGGGVLYQCALSHVHAAGG